MKKVLIVYDSIYGNTEKIAMAMAEAITGSAEVKVVRVKEFAESQLESVDFLVVGSPVHAGRPTLATKKFLSEIPKNALENVGVASFDTRMSVTPAKFFGYAAMHIAKSLKSKGGYTAIPSEGFIVEDREGPLRQGEQERAAAWVKGILQNRNQN